MRTIAIINQKGGCGKTTVSINLGATLAAKGHRTLLVDMDPQGHCALGLAVPDSQIQRSIYDMLRVGVDGSLVSQTVPTPLLTVDLKPKTFSFIREAMRYAVTDGTPAVAMTTPAVQAAGKTGTAQVSALKTDEEVSRHSWFASYAPVDAPAAQQVVVVVMAEATDVWEWWAPKVANVLLHGMFTGLDYDDVIDDLQPVTPMYSLIGEQPAEETSEGGTP